MDLSFFNGPMLPLRVTMQYGDRAVLDICIRKKNGATCNVSASAFEGELVTIFRRYPRQFNEELLNLLVLLHLRVPGWTGSPKPVCCISALRWWIRMDFIAIVPIGVSKSAKAIL